MPNKSPTEVADNGVGVVFVFTKNSVAPENAILIDVLFRFRRRHAHAAVG